MTLTLIIMTVKVKTQLSQNDDFIAHNYNFNKKYCEKLFKKKSQANS